MTPRVRRDQEAWRVDRALVERAKRGDREAFEVLARGVARRLYLIAYRTLRDADQAEDAVQSAFIAIWRDLPGLRDPERFQAWADRLVVRACLAEGRRTRRLGIRMVPITEDLVERSDAIADIATRDELEQAFRSISTEHRMVLVLHHYLGMPLADIAEVMGVPYGTVGSRIHHATRAMRASLEAGARTPALEGQQV
jgi:RNA polymerase sigma-70 factor (ECF subfamily)